MKQRTKKIGAVCLSGAMAMSLLAGSAVTVSAEEKIDLRVASCYVEGHSMNKVFEEVLTNFEAEHPNVTITREFMPSEQLQPKLKTDAASDNLPEIFPVWPGVQNTEDVKAGMWENLEDELEADPEWKAGFGSGTLEAFQYEEAPGYWGAPICTYGIGFYYNKEVFEAAGCAVPATWSELLETIGKLKDAGYTPWEMSGADTWRAEHLASYVYYKTYGIDQAAKLLDGSITYDDASFKDMFEKLVELVDAGAFNPNFMGYDYATEVANFATGNVGMQLNGAWAIGETDGPDTPDTIKGKIGFFPFPTMDGHDEFAGQWFGGVNDAFAMKAGLEGEEKELALELLKDLTSVETAKKIGEESGNIPAVQAELDPEKAGALMGEVVAAIGTADQLASDLVTMEPATEVGTSLYSIIQGVIAGQITPDDACAQLVMMKEASQG